MKLFKITGTFQSIWNISQTQACIRCQLSHYHRIKNGWLVRVWTTKLWYSQLWIVSNSIERKHFLVIWLPVMHVHWIFHLTWGNYRLLLHFVTLGCVIPYVQCLAENLRPTFIFSSVTSYPAMATVNVMCGTGRRRKCSRSGKLMTPFAYLHYGILTKRVKLWPPVGMD